MAADTKLPSRTGAYTLGRRSFARLSEVEGIRLDAALEEAFRDFDRRGLSPEERRRALLHRFALET
ncbi:MAG: hypothetical protein KGL29_06720 [Alphaproteobacteria bacterium]|nr:hypothetical protein [Alphaproteobacteria bacterium]